MDEDEVRELLITAAAQLAEANRQVIAAANRLLDLHKAKRGRRIDLCVAASPPESFPRLS